MVNGSSKQDINQVTKPLDPLQELRDEVQQLKKLIQNYISSTKPTRERNNSSTTRRHHLLLPLPIRTSGNKLPPILPLLRQYTITTSTDNQQRLL